MPTGELTLVLRYLRQRVGVPAVEPGTDADLLQRFVGTRDEAAFTELVRRHGPLVLGVCRRVVRQEEDAEDAFQATFLLLARQAASIRRRGALGAWLHEVAYHAALRARAVAHRRRRLERQAESMPPTDPAAEAARRELGAVLDAEVHRLPH